MHTYKQENLDGLRCHQPAVGKYEAFMLLQTVQEQHRVHVQEEHVKFSRTHTIMLIWMKQTLLHILWVSCMQAQNSQISPWLKQRWLPSHDSPIHFCDSYPQFHTSIQFYPQGSILSFMHWWKHHIINRRAIKSASVIKCSQKDGMEGWKSCVQAMKLQYCHKNEELKVHIHIYMLWKKIHFRQNRRNLNATKACPQLGARLKEGNAQLIKLHSSLASKLRAPQEVQCICA